MNNSQMTTSTPGQVFVRATLYNNPAWVQLLGLCPLLAVSNNAVNATALAAASAFVVIGSNLIISTLRHTIPNSARLPCFVLIIATFTTMTTLVLEAFAFDLYLKIALFVQIIVTNCMILGRAEAFASRQPVRLALVDAIGTGLGFAIALISLGTLRELLSEGTLFANFHLLLGGTAEQFSSGILPTKLPALFPLAGYAPGAFITAGVGIAIVNAVRLRRRHNPKTSTQ